MGTHMGYHIAFGLVLEAFCDFAFALLVLAWSSCIFIYGRVSRSNIITVRKELYRSVGHHHYGLASLRGQVGIFPFNIDYYY